MTTFKINVILLLHFHLSTSTAQPKNREKKFWAFYSVSVLIIWLVSFGVILAPKNFVKKHNRKIISLSIGAISGTLIFKLIPVSIEYALFLIQEKQGTERRAEILFLSFMVLAGILLALSLESLVHLTSKGHLYGHSECGADCKIKIELEQREAFRYASTMVKDVSDSELAERLHREISLTPPPHIFKLRYNGSVLEYVRKLPLFVVLDVIAKSVNHFFDSAIIGSLYYLDTASGIGASAGVLSHDISQYLGAFTVYLSFGLSKKASVFFCVLGSSPVLLGGILAYFIRKYIKSILPYIALLSVGNFLFLALSDHLPLIMHKHPNPHGKKKAFEKKISQTGKQKVFREVVMFVCFASGFSFLYLILYIVSILKK